MNKKDIICPMPFHAIDITPDQTVAPCCKFLDRKTSDDLDDNFFYSNYFEDVRTAMKKGKAVSACEACYADEKKGGYSFRKYVLEIYESKFNKQFEPDETKLESINIPFSNLCNNSCRMCNSKFSTNWYADEKALGWQIPKGQISKTDVIDKIDLSTVSLIHFLGGEPMLNQDKIIDILKNKCNLEKLTVVFTTNVTTIPNKELTDLLKKCNRVEWDLSIDAYGELNNFLRKGSEWETIRYNLDWFAVNFDILRVQSAVSIYNVNCFDKLARYIKQYKNIKHYIKLVHNVEPMFPRHLPKHAKEVILSRVHKIKKELDISACDAIINELEQQGDFKIFEEWDKQLNNVRREHWKNVNNELFDLVYKNNAGVAQ